MLKSMKCTCDVCKTAPVVERDIEHLNDEEKLMVLSAVAGDVLGKFEGAEREEMAKLFIRYMQKRAGKTPANLNGSEERGKAMDSFMDALIQAAKDAGFQVVNLK